MTDLAKDIPAVDATSQYEFPPSSSDSSRYREILSIGETYDEFDDDYNIIFVSNFVPCTPATLSRASTRLHPVRQVTDIHVVTTRGLSKETSTNICQRVSSLHEILFVAILSSAQLITQGTVNQAIVLAPTLAKQYNITDAGSLAWAAAGFSLTVGSFILIFGRLGDLFGYKLMMIIGFAWFSIWSMIAGLSIYGNFTMFVVARVMQGIGPSILLPNALALFGAAYAPGFRKGLIFSIFGASAPVGAIMGAAITALFIKAWWPWSFFTFSIILALLSVATWFVVPDFLKKAKRPSTLKKTIIACDVPGAVTGVSALVLINFAWNQAPTSGWSSPLILVTLILGVLLVPTFFYIELKISSRPLIPFEAISADVGLILACVSLGWGCFGIYSWYTFQVFMISHKLPPLLAVAWFSPVVISGPIAAIITSVLLHRIGPAPVMTIAMLGFTIGMTLIRTAPIDQTYWAQNFVAMCIMPFGMDMSFPAATIILSDAVKRENQGVAASLVNTVVNYSISLALGFAGTIEVNQNNGGETPEDTLHGYRSAMNLAVSLAGLGVVVSLYFMAKKHIESRRAKAAKEAEEK